MATGLEIEKKWLVIKDLWNRCQKTILKSTYIEQSYLPVNSLDAPIRLRYAEKEGRHYIEAIDVQGQVMTQGLTHKPCQFEVTDTEALQRLLVPHEGEPHAIGTDGFVLIDEKPVEARIRMKRKAGLGQKSTYVLTIKAKAKGEGARRELEFQIPAVAARKMLRYCRDMIKKTRHEVRHGNQTYEVDIYKVRKGPLKGLITAEAEFDNADALQAYNETGCRPIWLGQDVTNDATYSNRNLARVLTAG